jgi:putative ABC transport system ATP-binding protein
LFYIHRDGESTLVNIVGLLDDPDEGSYQFNGIEVANSMNVKGRSAQRNIGFFSGLILLMS